MGASQMPDDSPKRRARAAGSLLSSGPMVLSVSLLIVVAVTVVVFANAGAQGTLPVGFEQMIHARIPWLVLTGLVVGCGLGIGSLFLRRSVLRYGAVGLELAFSGLLIWYFTMFSFLPPHGLAVAAGDPFPGYSLVDHTGQVREYQSGAPDGAALYVFYRGDW